MRTQTNCMRTGGISPGYIILYCPEADQWKKLTIRGPSLARTQSLYEKEITVTRGTPGTCSLLHTMSSAPEWGLALTQVVPVIRDSKELQPICMHAQSCVTPWSVAARLLCPWNFPGKNTGVGSHFHPKRWCCESAALNMPANLKTSAVATGLEKASFHSNPKERQCQSMLKLPHNCTHLTC